MNRDTSWNEILDAISEYSPSFKTDIIGADEEEIKVLEQAVGRPLPREYREFLQLMGHGLGGLEIATSSFDISSVLDAYNIPNWRPPENLLFIGEQQDDENAFDVCIRLDDEHRGRIVRAVFSNPPHTAANENSISSIDTSLQLYDDALSLQALVFSYGFEQFHIRKTGFPYMFVRDVDVESFRDISKIEEIFISFGFRKFRLFDEWNNYYETDNNSVLAYLRPHGEGVQFLLSTDDQKLLEKFTKKVKDNLDMRLV